MALTIPYVFFSVSQDFISRLNEENGTLKQNMVRPDVLMVPSISKILYAIFDLL